MKLNTGLLLFFLVFVTFVKAYIPDIPCIPKPKTKTLPTKGQLKKRNDMAIDCAARGGTLTSTKTGCVLTTFCSIRPNATSRVISACPQKTKALPVTCKDGEVKSTRIVSTWHPESYREVCTSTQTYCTKPITRCPEPTAKTLPLTCTGSGVIKTSRVVTSYDSSYNDCTKVSTFCTKVLPTPAITTTTTTTTTTTPAPTATTLGLCPGAAKTLPVTCTGNNAITSRVVTTVDASNVPCTSVTTYCTKTLPPIGNNGTTYKECPLKPAKTLPIVCNSVRDYEIITTVDKSNTPCTYTMVLCAPSPTLPPFVPSCPTPTTKVLPKVCTQGVKLTKVVTSTNESNKPCTKVDTYCLGGDQEEPTPEITTPPSATPTASTTLAQCPRASAKTLPVTCKSGIKTTKVVTTVDASNVPCTSVMDYCTKTLSDPINPTTTTTTLPKCKNSKTLPHDACRFGKTAIDVVTTVEADNTPCTRVNTFCIHTATTLGECPSPNSKTLPLRCDYGYKTTELVTTVDASNVPCTTIREHCVKVKPTPIFETTTKTTTIAQETDCVPVTITITEKDIETITDKVTITKTIYEDAGETEAPSQNCAGKYEQCGGKNFKGPTCCRTGSCHVISEYYSQCY